MDKIITELDSYVCKSYVKNYKPYGHKWEFILDNASCSITALVKNITNIHILYKAVCMHPDLTDDILVNIIRQSKRTTDNYDDRSNIYIGRCRLITQEFCEKYKTEFMLSAREMISNRLPIKYIVDTHGGLYLFNKDDMNNIAKYSTESEYNQYCKPFRRIYPCLDNPHMTLDWYISGHGLDDIIWHSCAVRRPDLFTPEIIMKYKVYVGNINEVWRYYFDKFPVEFIEQNLELNYIALRSCIDVFKGHPGRISWHVIDKYISIHINPFHTITLDVPYTVKDMPRWFLKKYISQINLTRHHINAEITYKFIVKHIDNIDVGRHDMIDIRKQYINMLCDVTNVCSALNIPSDLHNIILEYC